MEIGTKFKVLSDKVDIMSKEVDDVLSDVYQIMSIDNKNNSNRKTKKQFQSYVNNIVENNIFKDLKIISLHNDKAILYIEVDAPLNPHHLYFLIYLYLYPPLAFYLYHLLIPHHQAQNPYEPV